jgi:peptide/nickel transport system substrate-binding protein
MTYVMGPPDPERLMRCFTSSDIAGKDNRWQRFNVWRWKSDEYDRLYHAAETEVDPVKRTALFIKMNDLVVQSGIVVPIALRAKAAASASLLRGTDLNPYEIDLWNVGAWYHDA